MTDVKTKELCSLPYCDRDALCPAKHSKVLVCHTHYNQDWAGKEFAPIRPYGLTHVDDKGRVCTTCNVYKEWDEFYTRTNRERNKQSECKVCMIARSKKNSDARLAKNEPCVESDCTDAALTKGRCPKHYQQHYYYEKRQASK